MKERIFEINNENNEILGKVRIVFDDFWGKLSIKSIYGDFSYAWYSIEGDFREFLAKACVTDYLAIKVIKSSSTTFNTEEIKNLKNVFIPKMQEVILDNYMKEVAICK